MMFESTPGDALEFFRNRFHWSDNDLATVNNIDPYLRMACRHCKAEYNLIKVVMTKFPNVMKECNLDGDCLRGSFSYRHADGYSGVFDSKRVRNDARATEISWLRFTLSYSLKSVHTS